MSDNNSLHIQIKPQYLKFVSDVDLVDFLDIVFKNMLQENNWFFMSQGKMLDISETSLITNSVILINVVLNL